MSHSVSKPATPASSRTLRGATLVEVLVAIMILGICMLFMTQLLVQESFLEQRTRARVASLRLLEAHAELLRGGLPLPDESGSYDMDLLVAPAPGAGVDRPDLELKLEQLEPVGLWKVDLELTYEVSGRSLAQSMEMRLWRP